jgi:cytochrome c oxidase subunit 3
MLLNSLKNTQKHPYHLVDPSPWPLVASMGCLFFTFGLVLFFHNYNGANQLVPLGFITIIYVMVTWWRDIIREATFEGQHTKQVQLGLRMGMALFILSEVMFFFGFFWAFFHSALAPTPEIGSLWPPEAIETINAWGIPLLNTFLLLTSGATVTVAHHAIRGSNQTIGKISLLVTVGLAILFTILQGVEYVESTFSISDSIYSSVFFVSTGFHGLHVLIGTIFLAICLYRLIHNHYTSNHHFGFEAAAWYWHFVDVVWLWLFIVVYWWGGK